MKRNFILYDDSEIVVVDKPACVYVHPSPGHEKGTLCDALVKLFPEMRNVGSVERPGVVHRLDAETSGVMVFAKTRRAYLKLREAFESHSRVRKTYLAVLHGAPKPPHGTLETTIGRKSWDAKRMAVDAADGKRAVTHWTVLEKHGPLAIVEFVIETGRTHQIRVHAAHLGHPIAGDSLYGDAAKDRALAVRPKRQLLHAVQIEFPHPLTNEMMCFAAPPPPDMIYAH